MINYLTEYIGYAMCVNMARLVCSNRTLIVLYSVRGRRAVVQQCRGMQMSSFT